MVRTSSVELHFQWQKKYSVPLGYADSLRYPAVIVFGRASGSDMSSLENAIRADNAFSRVHRKDRVILHDQGSPPQLAKTLLGIIADVYQGKRITLILNSISRAAHDLQFGLVIEQMLTKPNFKLYIGAARMDRFTFKLLLLKHAEKYAQSQMQASRTRAVKPTPKRQWAGFWIDAYKTIHFRANFKRVVAQVFEMREKFDPTGYMPHRYVAGKIARALNKRHQAPSSAASYTADLVRKHLENEQWCAAYAAWKLTSQMPVKWALMPS